MKNRDLGALQKFDIARLHLHYAASTLGVLLTIAGALFAATGQSHAAGRIFYDGFESGSTGSWQQDSPRNRCQVVDSSADGITGPFSGSKMARCNWNGAVPWNDSAAFETLMVQPNYTKEIFYRVWLRIDTNLTRTSGSTTKILRIYNTSPVYNDLFGSIQSNGTLRNEGVANVTQLVTYWGGYDSVTSSSKWHKVEYYINQATNRLKVWYDGVLIRDNTIASIGSGRWSMFYLTSNWSDPHDATNYAYFDEVEIFSDTGTGAGGLMSEASVFHSDSPQLPAPRNLR